MGLGKMQQPLLRCVTSCAYFAGGRTLDVDQALLIAKPIRFNYSVSNRTVTCSSRQRSLDI